jgi:hypothetical protein
MDAWTFGGVVVQALVASLVLTALTWAAIQRGRVHHYIRHESGDLIRADRRPRGLWRVVLQALRVFPRSHRLHLALGAIGEWV